MALKQVPVLYFTEPDTSQVYMHSPILVTEDSTFSRANVFGLFLTISLCLIVQPHGSLLYMRPHSILGRIVFFFWRLSPLACIMEAILLAIAFFDGIWLVARHAFSTSTRPMGLWNHIRTIATAIQLLRVHGRTPQHWGPFIDSQGQSRPPLTPVMDNSAASHSPVVNEPAAAHSPAVHQVVEPQLVDTEVAAFGPHYPADIETSQPGGTEPEQPSSIGSSRSIRSDPRRMFRPHAEFVLDLLGTAGAVIVIIRLASVVVPLDIRLPAAFMITNWAFVQVLHLVSNRRDADLLDTEYMIRHTVELEKRLNHVVVWTAFSLLLLPLFGYFTFVALFKSRSLPPALRETTSILSWCYLVFIDPLFFHFLPRMRLSRVTLQCSTEALPCPSSKRIALIVFQICKFVLCLCFGAYLGYSVAVCEMSEAPSPQYYILPFSVIPCMMWAWVFLPGISFMRHGSKGYEWMRGLALFYNLAMTGTWFTGTMIMYETKDTFKPNWLDWLGKLHRL